MLPPLRFVVGIAALLGGWLNPWTAAPLWSADALPPASQRFAAASAEQPDFQRHVVPLLGTLGCNGRACHGSFQGQGGFRLSLFGYDFAADHQALAGGDAPRVNAKEPDESLVLRKATNREDHEGGRRIEPSSWQERLLRQWIQGGAPAVAENGPQLEMVEVEPAEIVFARAGQTRQLRLIARWSDGTREDVTPLARFRANDESVAAISPSGLVTAKGPGDTHVIVFYDNAVVPVPVLQAISPLAGNRFPPVETPTRVDELIVDKLRKLGIVPAERCTDAEFLRRASLDLTGTLPLPDDVRAFLADASPDKRRRKIDELLESPAYAAWWATRLSDWTGNAEATGPLGGEQGLRRQFTAQWHDWLRRRLEQNVPYDQIAAGIVLAKSRRTGQSFEDYCAEMSSYFRSENPGDFAARETLPHFWMRRTLGPADEKARAFAYTFLGVRLECAQCHKHPFDQWTKQDFEQFSAFFTGVRYGATSRDYTTELKNAAGLKGLDEDSGDYKRKFVAALAAGGLLPFKEVSVPARAAAPRRKPVPNSKLGRVITPRLLGGEEVLTYEYDDPRQPLLDWLRQEDNPYFARALVNRVWAHHFGVGIVEPPDDMNLANPPSNAPLLDYLARTFVAQGYDLKQLHRELLASDAYQRSWQPHETGKRDERNFSRAILRRLPAEAAYDALVLATAGPEEQAALARDPARIRERAIGVSSGYSGARDEKQYAVNLFGRPAREIGCDCERSAEPSLMQTMYLRNDAEIQSLLDRRTGWLATVKQHPPADAAALAALVAEAYLRALGRLPTAAEQDTAARHCAASPSPLAGLKDLLWALVNTKEFMVNH